MWRQVPVSWDSLNVVVFTVNNGNANSLDMSVLPFMYKLVVKLSSWGRLKQRQKIRISTSSIAVSVTCEIPFRHDNNYSNREYQLVTKTTWLAVDSSKYVYWNLIFIIIYLDLNFHLRFANYFMNYHSYNDIYIIFIMRLTFTSYIKGIYIAWD